jgi:hypothetical protein
MRMRLKNLLNGMLRNKMEITSCNWCDYKYIDDEKSKNVWSGIAIGGFEYNCCSEKCENKYVERIPGLIFFEDFENFS